MAYLIACLVAVLAFFINRFLLRFIGPKVVVSLAPAVEEVLKTLPPYLLSADILLTHAAFGLIEAVFDMKNGRHKAGAAAASLIGHTFFGAVAVFILQSGGGPFLAVTAAYVFHLGWNVVAVLITTGRKDKPT